MWWGVLCIEVMMDACSDLFKQKPQVALKPVLRQQRRMTFRHLLSVLLD